LRPTAVRFSFAAYARGAAKGAFIEMGGVIRTITALLLASSILIAGNGLQNQLLAIRANLEGFPLHLIGMLLSVYSAGFILGCRYAPVLVKRVGHIRTFTALASLASAAALIHVIFVSPFVWIALRVVTGFALAGLQMIIESWINERATNETRGRVLSVYRIIDLGATTVGQLLLTIADPMGFALFALVSILVSLALVPVALTTATAPQPIATAKLDIAKLYRVSPLAAVGSFSVGLANGAFWAMGAVYVQQIGYDITAVAVFMSAVVVAGAVAQWPLGYLSDRIDRRWVIVSVSALCAVSGAYLAAAGGRSFVELISGGIAFGLFAMPLFGLSVAHANDRAQPDEYIETNGGLFLLYGVGAVAGPILGPTVMSAASPGALFLYTSGVYALLTAFGLLRVMQRERAPKADREAYVAVPRTSPVVFELDPRTEESHNGEAASRPAGEGA